jgi:hypothetical protein
VKDLYLRCGAKTSPDDDVPSAMKKVPYEARQYEDILSVRVQNE